jgi:hypothetical protein
MRFPGCENVIEALRLRYSKSDLKAKYEIRKITGNLRKEICTVFADIFPENSRFIFLCITLNETNKVR